jgi:hypothetical protein
MDFIINIKKSSKDQTFLSFLNHARFLPCQTLRKGAKENPRCILALLGFEGGSYVLLEPSKRMENSTIFKLEPSSLSSPRW